MPISAPPIAELVVPAAWQAVDCISDLHLDAQHPATLRALQTCLAQTRADAVFILGDLFEVWVGDDAIHESGSFEDAVCALLHEAAVRRPIFFMHGNRDFLVGDGFTQATGLTLLADPTVLTLRHRRWLLSHGDALCLDDVPYQQFRAMVHSTAWQAQWLAQPLQQRRRLARDIRSESESRKQAGDSYADVDRDAALHWLHTANAGALVHGHTHRPADHLLAPGLPRHVLTDWDLDVSPPRAEVLRLSGSAAQRLALEDV